MPFGIQPIHILIIIVVALLVFGPKRLPEIGRGIGRAISEFRHGTKEMTDSFREEVNKPVETQAAPPAPTVNRPVETIGTPSTPAQPQSSGAAGNFCIQCGAPNVPEARFCSHCGAQLPNKAV